MNKPMQSMGLQGNKGLFKALSFLFGYFLISIDGDFFCCTGSQRIFLTCCAEVNKQSMNQ